MTEEQLRLLARMIRTQDGKDFVEEILRPMLFQNHKDLLKDGKQFRDELIGFGNCLQLLVGLFETCDIKLESSKVTEAPDRI